MQPIAYAMHIWPDVCEIKDWKFSAVEQLCFFIRLEIKLKELILLHCSSCVAVQGGLLK